jgi:hypothetical protein
VCIATGASHRRRSHPRKPSELSWLLVSSAAGSLRNRERRRLEQRDEIVSMQVVFGALIRSVRFVVARIAERLDVAMRTATRPVSPIGGLLRDLTRSPQELLAENMALRQQRIVAARAVKQPRFTARERGLLSGRSRSTWSELEAPALGAELVDIPSEPHAPDVGVRLPPALRPRSSSSTSARARSCTWA